MERLQGPINPCLFGEYLNVESLEQGGSSLDFSYGPFVNTESFRFEDEQQPFSTSSLQDKMPFLQMLQSVESPPFSPFTEPNFELLLRLQQQKKPWERNYLSEMDSRVQTRELESCITHDVSEAHSPVKSETKEHQYPHSSSCPEVVSSVYNREHNSPENKTGSKPKTQFAKPPPISRERRKRKRTRPSKNRDEVESQRMTHIAVERNRRKQMNDHLNSLRLLMPTSFIQRGDQASIIGGAIDFVKELEQLLQSLQAQKRMRRSQEEGNTNTSESLIPFNGFFTSPQYTTYMEAENKSAGVADIEVIVIQTHVNLKILSPRRPGQLLTAIASLEDLRLTILHLNVTSSESSVLYSFNLKIEDDCKLGSADEIATAVHQIFSYINGN